MHNGRAGRASQVFQVMDPRGLAELISEVVADRSGGILHAAWVETNKEVQRRTGRRSRTGIRPIDYATIQRLKSGKTGRLKQSTVSWLLVFIPKADHDRFYDTIFSPAAQRNLALHDNWVLRETAHLRKDTDKGPIATEMAKTRALRVSGLLAEMEELEPDVFKNFHQAAKHHRRARVQLSRLELVRPFLAGKEGVGI
jgi:hypothetical protein